MRHKLVTWDSKDLVQLVTDIASQAWRFPYLDSYPWTSRNVLKPRLLGASYSLLLLSDTTT
jgi:hypothetical protein